MKFYIDFPPAFGLISRFWPRQQLIIDRHGFAITLPVDTCVQAHAYYLHTYGFILKWSSLIKSMWPIQFYILHSNGVLLNIFCIVLGHVLLKVGQLYFALLVIPVYRARVQEMTVQRGAHWWSRRMLEQSFHTRMEDAEVHECEAQTEVLGADSQWVHVVAVRVPAWHHLPCVPQTIGAIRASRLPKVDKNWLRKAGWKGISNRRRWHKCVG